jgi:membrane associated rhomboid family serine protease
MFPIANGVPLRYPPVATWALIAVNWAVFLFQLSLSPSELDAFLDRYALIPARYFDVGGFDSGPQPIICHLSATCSCTAAGCT